MTRFNLNFQTCVKQIFARKPLHVFLQLVKMRVVLKDPRKPFSNKERRSHFANN